MEDAARLVAAFKQLRDGKGLTVEKLNFEAARLLELLLTPGDPEAALKVLDELIDAIPDSRFAGVVGDFPPRIGKRAVAKAVRVALAIGTDDEGMPLASHGAKVTERRRWACGEDPLAPREDCFFQEGVPRTHQRYEDDQGFPALARLILHRHQVETTRAPLHEETQERPDTTGEEASLVAAESVGFATAFEPNGPDQNLALAPAAASNGRPFGRVIRAAPFGLSRLSVTPQQRRAKLAILSGTSIGIAIFATLMLAASGVIPLWPHPSSAGDRSPAANLPRVTGSVSAPPNIDNTRGWGPSRKTFTMQHPAPYPVFNSITDNPVHGNELNFVQCKDTAKDGQSWADEMVALDGHTYQCYLWVDNDVAPNLDSSAETNGGGNVAAKLQNARVRISYPSSPTYNPGLVGILSADNAPEVWDSCNFVAPRPVSLRYVLGSARLHTNGTPNGGAALPGVPDALVQAPGALLGDKGDGMVGQNAGYLLFDMKVTLG